MTNFIKYACIGGLALVPVACVTKFDPTIANPALENELAVISAPDAWIFQGDDDAKLASDWSDVIADPVLHSMIDEALTNSQSLRATRESISRSTAFLRQARSSLYPGVDASVSATGSSPFEDADLTERYSGALDVSWQVDLWGRIDADIASAKFDLAGSEAFYANARQSLIAAVAQAYIGAIEAKQQQQLTEATRDALLETLRIVEVRRRSGFSSERELVLAQSDVANARDSLEVADASLRNSVRGLEVLLGRYPSGTMEIPSEFPQINFAIGAGTPASLLHRRPDILVAEYDLRAAFADEHVVREGPALVLSGGLSTAATDIGDIFDPANLAISIGARLADSLIDGGFDDARIEAAEANTRQALANYGQTVLDALADVEARLDNLAVSDVRSGYVSDAAHAARETLRLAEIQYREGEVDLLDVLTFRQRSFQADRTLLSIESTQLNARVFLFLSLGGAPTPTPDT